MYALYLRMWRFCLSSIVIVDIVQEYTGQLHPQ